MRFKDVYFDHPKVFSTPLTSPWVEIEGEVDFDRKDLKVPQVLISGFLAPHLSLVKVWLAQNTPARRDKAANYLGQLKEYFSQTYNTRFLIETLALQAILDLALGNKFAALTVLEKALRLAQPGGFIRIFVDMGPQMARALTQVQVDRELHGYVKVLLSAFPKSQQVVNLMDQEKILEPLTNRELQILELLGNRLTNKEIASQLMLSPGTIKGHTIRIFHKLDVGDRRQAVKKATELGLLSPSKG